MSKKSEFVTGTFSLKGSVDASLTSKQFSEILISLSNKVLSEDLVLVPNDSISISVHFRYPFNQMYNN